MNDIFKTCAASVLALALDAGCSAPGNAAAPHPKTPTTAQVEKQGETAGQNAAKSAIPKPKLPFHIPGM